MALPSAIVEDLRHVLLDRQHPLFLEIDKDYTLRHWQGDADYYGFAAPSSGIDCRELIPALYGLDLDTQGELAFIEAPNGRAFDLNVRQIRERRVLVMLDATEARDWRRDIQQQANDIRLLQHRQEQLIGELRTARLAVEEKHRQAQEASRVKGRFIAGMSHEFRTPLASILGQVETLREAGRAELAQGIESQAGYLLSLIDNMLDQAKLESGQLALSRQPVHVEELRRDMQAMFEPMARKRGLQFESRTLGNLPEVIELDPMRVRQVMVNLLANAFKYTPEGSVQLILAWTGEYLQVAVQDTGPGIPAEARERIFHAFHQEPKAAGETREGVGLGLSISAGLVAAMGGEIGVREAESGGSVFHFRIPAKRCEPARGAGQISGLRVLLADDNVDMRRLLSHHLEKAGARVTSLTDGGGLLATLHSFQPQVVIMDLYLGDEDGTELVKEVRRTGYTGGVLLLSASTLKSDRERAFAAGCDEVMSKPIKSADLRRKVAELAALDR